MKHYSSLYLPPVIQGTKRWAMWAFMQGVWDNGSEKGTEPTIAMLEAFLRNMYPDEQFKSGNLCELAYFRHTVIQKLPVPDKPV